MRFFYLLISLVLIGAVVMPFYIKGPTGTPLMTVDDLIEDNTPQALKVPTEVYRWKDEHGQWQFGDAPPEQTSAQRVEVNENLTPMGKEWIVEEPKPEAGTGSGYVAPSTISIGDAAEVMQRAKEAAAMMEEHTAKTEEILQRTR